MNTIDRLLNFLFGAPKRPKIFVSYDHDEDRRFRDLLCAWDANSRFDFTFERCSPMIAIDSDAPVIKRQLTKMMKRAEYLLVIVGEYTHRSEWIRWEIERATKDDINLGLVVVKLRRDYKTPDGLRGRNARFVYSFTLSAIVKALESIA